MYDNKTFAQQPNAEYWERVPFPSHELLYVCLLSAAEGRPK